MEGIKTIKVINDLELEIKGRSVTIAGGIYGRCAIGIAGEELPALLAALKMAAGEMGVETPSDVRISSLKSTIRLAATQLENGNPSYALDTLKSAGQ